MTCSYRQSWRLIYCQAAQDRDKWQTYTTGCGTGCACIHGLMSTIPSYQGPRATMRLLQLSIIQIQYITYPQTIPPGPQLIGRLNIYDESQAHPIQIHGLGCNLGGQLDPRGIERSIVECNSPDLVLWDCHTNIFLVEVNLTNLILEVQYVLYITNSKLY